LVEASVSTSKFIACRKGNDSFTHTILELVAHDVH